MWDPWFSDVPKYEVPLLAPQHPGPVVDEYARAPSRYQDRSNPEPLVPTFVKTSACHCEYTPGATLVGAYPQVTTTPPVLAVELVDVVEVEVV